MPPRSVARFGDVFPTPGATPFTGAQSGTWTAGAVAYTSYEKLVSGGANVISEARCTFNFTGANSSGATVTGTETVVLSAESTKLQRGASNVILDGDSATGEFGNTLAASSGAKLETE